MPHFCSACGGALETRRPPGDHRDRQVCTACGRIHYRNAKPCTEVLVERDGQILLVRRAIDPAKGKWDIPGGYLEADELPEDGAIRELREETGLAITITGLLGIYLDGYHYGPDDEATMSLCYLATAEGEPVAGDDAAAVGWFTPDTLPPPDQLAFRHQPQALAEWQQRVRGEV